MNIIKHEPVKCPICDGILKPSTHNKVLQKRAEGEDWADLWCNKCKLGFDRTLKEPLASKEEIPEKVRVAVWKRDEGKCVKCGNREKLEYDHIIPRSKGGSNTIRNIELLCEKCNRAKGSKIK